MYLYIYIYKYIQIEYVHLPIYVVDTRQHGITSSLANDNGTFPCQSALCKTCVLVYNLMDLPFGDRQVYHVTGRYNCAASAVVFLITCSVCDAAYVGETGRTLRERMNGHRQDIRSHADTPVALHFGESTHNLRVSVIQQAALVQCNDHE